MHITRNGIDTMKGPADWFTGDVYVGGVAGAPDSSRPGDRVFFEPGEDHWHGAAPNRFMSHLAIHEADDQGVTVAWGEHVTDEEYDAAPAS